MEYCVDECRHSIGMLCTYVSVTDSGIDACTDEAVRDEVRGPFGVGFDTLFCSLLIF